MLARAQLKRNFLKMKRRKTLAIIQKEKKNTRGRTYFIFYSLGRCSLVNTDQLLSFDGPTRHNNSCRQSALAKGKAEPAARTYACSGNPGSRLTATRRGSSHLPPPLAVAADKLTSE